jgi:hypothetical protein
MSYQTQNPRFIKAFVQAGVLAQGLPQCLAVVAPQPHWDSFGSWLRTIRPGFPPSEFVVANALRQTFPNFSWLPQKAILSPNSSLSGRTQKICGLPTWHREQKDGLLSYRESSRKPY